MLTFVSPTCAELSSMSGLHFLDAIVRAGESVISDRSSSWSVGLVEIDLRLIFVFVLVDNVRQFHTSIKTR